MISDYLIYCDVRSQLILNALIYLGLQGLPIPAMIEIRKRIYFSPQMTKKLN